MMTKERARHIWQNCIIPGYESSVEVTRFGLTGDPSKAVAKAVECGASKEEIREVLGILAHIKKGDGRFYEPTRNWLYAGVSAEACDWYREWARVLGDTDHIHTAHLDGLAGCLKRRWNEI